jgi:hypothetical protein
LQIHVVKTKKGSNYAVKFTVKAVKTPIHFAGNKAFFSRHIHE